MNILKIIKNSSILRQIRPVIRPATAGVILGLCLFCAMVPHIGNARYDSASIASYVAKNATEAEKKIVKKISATITAYSSTPDQTDDTPFTTASGKTVADGIIANNGLKIGTKVQIPDLYGDKVFVVEDRMNRRMGEHRFDIWMPSKTLALNFGVKKTEIVVLED